MLIIQSIVPCWKKLFQSYNRQLAAHTRLIFPQHIHNPIISTALNRRLPSTHNSLHIIFKWSQNSSSTYRAQFVWASCSRASSRQISRATLYTCYRISLFVLTRACIYIHTAAVVVAESDLRRPEFHLGTSCFIGFESCCCRLLCEAIRIMTPTAGLFAVLLYTRILIASRISIRFRRETMETWFFSKPARWYGSFRYTAANANHPGLISLLAQLERNFGDQS